MGRQYIELRATDFLSRVLPLRLSYWIGLRTADRFFRRDLKGRRAVVDNLRHILRSQGQDPSDVRLESLARCVFQHFGKYVVDFFRFTQVSPEEIRNRVVIEHREYLDQALSHGRGMISITAHLGNWEVGGAAIAALGYPFNAVVLPQTDRRVDELFQSRRQRRGIRVIPLGQAARGTLKALHSNQVVALLADRDYTSRNDLVPFFGAPARMPTGPARLCARTGAPVVPGFLLRMDDDNFLLRLHPPILPAGEDDARGVQEQIISVLQREVAERPTQWFMFKPFWNHNGEEAGT